MSKQANWLFQMCIHRPDGSYTLMRKSSSPAASSAAQGATKLTLLLAATLVPLPPPVCNAVNIAIQE